MVTHLFVVACFSVVGFIHLSIISYAKSLSEIERSNTFAM